MNCFRFEGGFVRGLLKATLTIFTFVYASQCAYSEANVYVDESEFLNALQNLGYSVVQEGFESDSAWGDVRSSIVSGNHTLEFVSHLGIVWTSNNLSSEITTSSGAARTGAWGLYSLPHGSYTQPDPGANCANPEECGDGIRGQTEMGVFYAVGGWFDTNTPFAKLGLYIGQYPDRPVDFGEICDATGENCINNSTIGTAKEFFGIIDPTGFPTFEFRELEGNSEDAKFIFADDFSFAGSNLYEDNPVVIWQSY